MEKEAMKTIRRCRKYTMIFSVIGFGLAYYSVYVSASKTRDPNYQALCDISEEIRCSKAFTSSFGKGLGIVGKILGEDSPFYQSNGVYGMLMYTAFILCSLFPYRFFAKLGVTLGIIANILSCYLAYILLFIIRDYCVVCIATYAIGAVLLAVAFKNMHAVNVIRNTTSQNYSRYLDGKVTPGKKRI